MTTGILLSAVVKLAYSSENNMFVWRLLRF